MEFSKETTLEFEEAVDIMFEKLGDWKVCALGTSVNNRVTVRNVSCLFYDGKIYFKTDKNFRKTKQLYENPNVGMCWSGIQIEGRAIDHGLVVDEPGRKFEKGFEKYLKNTYNAYSHKDTEILIEVVPEFAEVWDTSDDGRARMIYIDYKDHSVRTKEYDL